MGTVRNPALYSFEVRHPEFGVVYVDALDRGDALMKAAARWGVKWTELAAECDVRKYGIAQKAKCRKCGTEVKAPGLCPDCARAEEQYRRDVSRLRSQDRRAGYRERQRTP